MFILEIYIREEIMEMILFKKEISLRNECDVYYKDKGELFKKDISYFRFNFMNKNLLKIIDENIYVINFELLNEYYCKFEIKSEKSSKIVLEEEKELPMSALDILDTNNDLFLLKLKKNSEINIVGGNDWNLLSIFPPNLIKRIQLKFLASKICKETVDFIIKFKKENPHVDLEWDISFDTNEF